MDASSQSRSGIHRLPDKILSSIFLNAINECDDSAEVAFLPLMLSHTSSRWREVCISTSFLWTSIYMSLPYRHNQSPIQNQLVYLRTWISRSDSSPLNIHLDFRDPEWDWNEETHRFTSAWASQILSIILPHANRWKHIEFIADTWAPIHVFLAASAASSSESLQLLESMALSRCNAYFARKGELFKPVSLREPVPLFGGARLPSLRGLSLAGVHIDWRSCSSFKNLLELELKFHAYDVMPTLGEFRDIITTSPELERLSIVGWGPRLLDASGATSSQENVLPRVMTIPKLTKFCFGFVDVEYAVKLLSLFNLPSLQKLELEDVAAIVDPMGSSDASAILHLLGEFSTTAFTAESFFYPLHQVECLDLRSIRSNSEMAFINFFRCLSSLKDLSLMDIDSTLLSSLGPPSNLSMPYPLPQLVHLVCRRLDAKTLAAVLSARAEYAARSGLQPLQSVQFELDRSDVDNGLSSVLSDEDRNALMNTGVELMIHLNDV